MLTERTRAVLRPGLRLALWWPAFLPALDVASAYPAAAVAFLCAVGSFWRVLCNPLSVVLFHGAMVYLLANTYGAWVFPPAFWGILYVLGSAALFLFSRAEESVDAEPCPLPNDAAISPFFWSRRMRIAFATWGIGLAILCVHRSPWIVILIAGWSILMFLLIQGQFSFLMNEEWHGYKMRRECFVPPLQWRLRFIGSAFFVALIILAYVFFHIWLS